MEDDQSQTQEQRIKLFNQLQNKKKIRGGYISSSTASKQLIAFSKKLKAEGENHTWLSFLKICFDLIKRRVFSWNGFFNGTLFLIGYYILFKRKFFFLALLKIYKSLEKLEA